MSAVLYWLLVWCVASVVVALLLGAALGQLDMTDDDEDA